MDNLTCTLVSEGSSDQALLPILRWVLRRAGIACSIQTEWADLRRLSQAPRDFGSKIRLAVELYPCDLLFVHRDADREPREVRIEEIEAALGDASRTTSLPPAIAVVPVRAQEAWLLFDEKAIRRAAGNPNGRDHLVLPSLGQLEHLPNPKELLYRCLAEASGLQGRRLKRFPASRAARLVAEFIEDFSPLERLGAFSVLESEISKFARRAAR